MSEIKDSLGLENVGIVRRNCDIDTLIKFAVEIQDNKIFQSKSKYNQDLQDKEMSLVNGWFKEHFGEKISTENLEKDT